MKSKLEQIIQFPQNLQQKEGYWQYLASDFGAYLQKYLKVFEQQRQESGMIPPTEKDWKLLPFGSFAKTPDWKWRRQSLRIFKKVTQGKHFESVLEIGPWNGWLTKFLAQKSEVIIAADYFVLAFDGIANIRDFAENIVSVQCNVATISTDFKTHSFDLIVLNHNLSFMENPVDYINGLIPLLKPNGLIISVGNVFYKNPQNKIQANILMAENYKRLYQKDLYIQPVKGYMDYEDKKALTNSGFIIKEYKVKLVQNWYSRFNGKAPYYSYIIYKNA